MELKGVYLLSMYTHKCLLADLLIPAPAEPGVKQIALLQVPLLGIAIKDMLLHGYFHLIIADQMSPCESLCVQVLNTGFYA